LALAVGGFLVWQLVDEIRLRSVEVGDTRDGVRARLGLPAERRSLTNSPSGGFCGAPSTEEYTYQRWIKNSLFVEFDESGKVSCVSRMYALSRQIT
jgi:hypothetical protein